MTFIAPPPPELGGSFPENDALPELTPYSTPPNLSWEAPSYIDKTSQYITILDMNTPIGKQFGVVDGKLTKRASPNNGEGFCRTVHVPTAAIFKETLDQISLSEKGAIILGFVKGTEPEAGQRHGETYQLTTDKRLRELSGSTKKRNRVWKNKEGLHVAARTATLFERSTWVCFDLDTNEFTPPELVANLETKGYHNCLLELIPQLQGVEFVSVPSSSSRISLNGQKQYKENHHIYMQTIDVTDQRRFAMATMLKAQETVYGYSIPAINAKTKDPEPWRRPTHSSIIDVSVFARARIMFEGKPTLDPSCLETQSGLLQIQPIQSVAFAAPFLAIDSVSYRDPVFKKQQSLGFEFISGVHGFRAINNEDLTPDILIEYKNDEDGDTGFMTMKEFVDGDIPRLRAQNPFKPSSTSWSAFLSKENAEGHEIHPRLHSVEYGTYLYNDSQYVFERTEVTPAYETPNISTEPPRQPQFDAASPPERVEPRKDLPRKPRATIQEQSQSLARYTGRTHQIPDQLSDPLLGQFFIERYFDGRPVIAIVGKRDAMNLFEWNGFHYEPINKALVKHYLVEGARLGKVNSFTTSKLSSVVGMLGALSYAAPPEPLPRHMTPFANGLFDFTTGKLSSHDSRYFYTDVKDVFYDPDATCDEYIKTITVASNGSPDWIKRFNDLMSYLLVGGDNTDHKIIWIDGLPRSGKSTIVKTLLKLVHSYMPVELAKLVDPKVLINCANKAFVFDDDTQTPDFRIREEVTGILKKMSTGGLFEITQLYTEELFETTLSTKLAFLCNGLPTLYDPSGALVDRSELIHFDVSHANDADTGIEARLNQPSELSGMFNLLWRNYLDLIKRSGYKDLHDYTNNPRMPLRFHKEPASTEAKMVMRSENEPLSEFVEEMLEFTKTDDDMVFNRQLIAAVREYADDNTHMNYLTKWGNTKILRTLRNILVRNGSQITKRNNQRGYGRLKLKDKQIDWS